MIAPEYCELMARYNRGRLTTLLHQAGHDPCATDIPWLPGVVRLVEAP